MVFDSYMVAEEIGVDTTTAGTEGNLYVVVYTDNEGAPGNLVYTTPALSVLGTTFKSATGLNVPFVPGLYWVGCLINGVVTTAATVRSVANNSRYIGETAGGNDIAMSAYITAATLASTPPAIFPAISAVAAAAPRILFKCKSTQ